MTRREFVGGALAAAGAGALGMSAAGAAKPGDIRAVYLSIGTGMWWSEYCEYKGRMIVHEPTWRRLTASIAEKGLNMLVIDIGEAVMWPSHPEISCPGAWSVEKLRAELSRLRSMGIEPIPKLNFSTTHNFWLGEYRWMCSTRKYFEVCDDLVRDITDMFDRPRFLHIGFDEEKALAQGGCDLAIARGHDRWYHDLCEHVRSCEAHGARAWMWSDRGWHDKDFVKRCPKSVLQSNWYYDEDLQGFDPAQANEEFASRLNLLASLDKAGFDQVPCGSNWKSAIQRGSKIKSNRSMLELMRLCRDTIDPSRLKGFLMAPWSTLNEAGEKELQEGIDIFAEAYA